VKTILELFQNFYRQYPFLELEQAIAYFSLYGGREREIRLNLFDGIVHSVKTVCVEKFGQTEQLIEPAYLLEQPYQGLLAAVAGGDGRLSNVYRRARIGESAGETLLAHLSSLGVVNVEASRQAPIRSHPKQQVKKHLRSYRIEGKVRFVRPFDRFWFGFVVPYKEQLAQGDGEAFLAHFKSHKEQLYSLVFEQLSNLLMRLHFQKKDPLVSQGSFWDHHSEFDLLSVTRSGRIVLGECKYTSRPVTKKELTKLKEKANQSGIRVDTYVLFSKSGFSKELWRMQDSRQLLLFDLEAFSALLVSS